MTTIKDIAREAGVSVSTVSFAINGSAPVAPETKKRIFEVIERLNYHPSTSARGLVSRKTNNICLYIPHPSSSMFNFTENSMFNDLLQGVGETIDDKDYNLLLAWDQSIDASNNKALSLARSRAVDGILFMSPSHNFQPIFELMEMKFPFVFMGRAFPDKPIDVVDIDNFDAGYRGTQHLIKLGHKRIAFISPGPLDYLLAEDRFEGYREALLDANLKYNEQYLHIGNYRKESGYEAMARFCSLKERPTAIVAGRDAQAAGIIEYAKAHSLRIPDDLALVSFENSELAKSLHISSIDTDVYRISKEAAKQLIHIINRKKERQPQNIVIPSELYIRSTCGALKSSPNV